MQLFPCVCAWHGVLALSVTNTFKSKLDIFKSTYITRSFLITENKYC